MSMVSLFLGQSGGTLVSIVGRSEERQADGFAIDFVVDTDNAQLGEIVQRVRDGRLRANIGPVAPLDAAIAALNSTTRRLGRWSSAFVRKDWSGFELT